MMDQKGAEAVRTLLETEITRFLQQNLGNKLSEDMCQGLLARIWARFVREILTKETTHGKVENTEGQRWVSGDILGVDPKSTGA